MGRHLLQIFAHALSDSARKPQRIDASRRLSNERIDGAPVASDWVVLSPGERLRMPSGALSDCTGKAVY